MTVAITYWRAAAARPEDRDDVAVVVGCCFLVLPAALRVAPAPAAPCLEAAGRPRRPLAGVCAAPSGGISPSTWRVASCGPAPRRAGVLPAAAPSAASDSAFSSSTSLGAPSSARSARARSLLITPSNSSAVCASEALAARRARAAASHSDAYTCSSASRCANASRLSRRRRSDRSVAGSRSKQKAIARAVSTSSASAAASRAMSRSLSASACFSLSMKPRR
mmetsp:Transcript_16210/g.41950  ORF Transcript_16210/g.41950 Transcript_16210/m.41950 type:complete len:222 (+) Transcript_16210:79-744(+)